jgi:hypothetical protein
VTDLSRIERDDGERQAEILDMIKAASRWAQSRADYFGYGI